MRRGLAIASMRAPHNVVDADPRDAVFIFVEHGDDILPETEHGADAGNIHDSCGHRNMANQPTVAGDVP
jgi:hypothetical protein